MSNIVDIYKRVTPSQKSHAAKLAQILRSKGFKADHLDDLIFQLAAHLGDSIQGDSVAKDKQVDAELSAADELNMSSMDRQLEFLAAHYVTEEALINAVETALLIDLNSDA